jgi:hypothetical protein
MRLLDTLPIPGLSITALSANLDIGYMKGFVWRAALRWVITREQCRVKLVTGVATHALGRARTAARRATGLKHLLMEFAALCAMERREPFRTDGRVTTSSSYTIDYVRKEYVDEVEVAWIKLRMEELLTVAFDSATLVTISAVSNVVSSSPVPQVSVTFQVEVDQVFYEEADAIVQSVFDSGSLEGKL